MASSAPSPVDAELLALLEDAFRHHAGGGATLDVAALKRALGLRSDYLARRVLAQFDADGDGTVDRDEFLAGVRALVLGSDREKLAFAFRLWDHDGDGRLDREELHRMIALSLAESDVEERPTQPATQLVATLLSTADTDKDGRLSLDELERVVRRHPELLARMTRSEAIWIAPNEELLLLLDERAGRIVTDDVTATSNRRAQLVFLAVWVLANVAVFAWSMIYGRASQTTDAAMKFGRAVGACIDLDAGFVLLPVMRRLLTWVRPTWLGRVVPVDDAIGFHKIVGHTLFALALTHATSLVLAYGEGHPAAGPLHVLATGRGLTGGLLLGVFAVMWIFSQSFVRRSKRFEVFYFTHLLYVVWLALVVAHGPRILVFSGIAIVTFVVEQLLRLRRRRPAAKVVRTYPLRSGVTRVEITRPPGFTFGAGDYVFLRIPAVARHEWHPFTISSAPEVENSSSTFARSATGRRRSGGAWRRTAKRRSSRTSTGRTVRRAVASSRLGSPCSSAQASASRRSRASSRARSCVLRRSRRCTSSG